MTTRRDFLSATSLVVAGTVLTPQVAVGAKAATTPALPFQISLAEWSLHQRLFGKQMTSLDFPGNGAQGIRHRCSRIRNHV
jgi:hypothetical protein